MQMPPLWRKRNGARVEPIEISFMPVLAPELARGSSLTVKSSMERQALRRKAAISELTTTARSAIAGNVAVSKHSRRVHPSPDGLGRNLNRIQILFSGKWRLAIFRP